MANSAFLLDRLALAQDSLGRAQRRIHRQRRLIRGLERCGFGFAAAGLRRTLEDIEAVERWLAVKRGLLVHELVTSEGVQIATVIMMLQERSRRTR